MTEQNEEGRIFPEISCDSVGIGHCIGLEPVSSRLMRRPALPLRTFSWKRKAWRSASCISSYTRFRAPKRFNRKTASKTESMIWSMSKRRHDVLSIRYVRRVLLHEYSSILAESNQASSSTGMSSSCGRVANLPYRNRCWWSIVFVTAGRTAGGCWWSNALLVLQITVQTAWSFVNEDETNVIRWFNFPIFIDGWQRKWEA